MSEPQDSACLDCLIEENRLALHQLQAFLERLTPTLYRYAFGPTGRQSLGKHVRHILDHYDALLAGAGVGSIDYENRQRDERLEAEPVAAVARVVEISAALPRLHAHHSTTQQMRYPVDGACSSLTLSTSLARELAFMTSHTVHHMALLGFMAEQLGVALPDDFGVHPSTLRFWRRSRIVPQAAGAFARSSKPRLVSQ
ncbi:DinB family protein [Billgrantia sp. Q4P2]|uniref:DinB family protein n=1 Tax=Billgrantia sp. Q4P2 TaxID=3463857 RepID=UPI004056F9D3